MSRAFCRILAEMHEAARDLRSTGAIDAAKMRKFDELCLPNATTIAAMQERDLPKFSSLAEFMAALDEDEAE